MLLMYLMNNGICNTISFMLLKPSKRGITYPSYATQFIDFIGFCNATQLFEQLIGW